MWLPAGSWTLGRVQMSAAVTPMGHPGAIASLLGSSGIEG